MNLIGKNLERLHECKSRLLVGKLSGAVGTGAALGKNALELQDEMLRELGLEFPKMFLATSNWFQAMERENYFELDGDHAEEMETSLLLHLKPELVLPRSAWGDGKEKKHKISEFSESWLWTERKWSKVTEDTGIGNPKFANKEKGERFFKDVTEKISKAMIKRPTDLDSLGKINVCYTLMGYM